MNLPDNIRLLEDAWPYYTATLSHFSRHIPVQVTPPPDGLLPTYPSALKIKIMITMMVNDEHNHFQILSFAIVVVVVLVVTFALVETFLGCGGKAALGRNEVISLGSTLENLHRSQLIPDGGGGGADNGAWESQ